MRTIGLHTISNRFMTFAWYGHLKYREVPLYKVIAVRWLIAFFEYCFQVPANRIASYEFTAAQLKTNPGSHHPHGVRRFLSPVSETTVPLELRSRLRPDRGGGSGDLQEGVREACIVADLPSSTPKPSLC